MILQKQAQRERRPVSAGIAFLFALLLLSVVLPAALPASAADAEVSFSAGDSVVAKDQSAAGVNFEGMPPITWLDFGSGDYSIRLTGMGEGIFNLTLSKVGKPNRNIAIDSTGKVVVGEGYAIETGFSEGMAFVSKVIDGNTVGGFVDISGREAIPVGSFNAYGWNSAGFHEGLADVSAYENWPGDLRVGFVDTDGKLVIPCRYSAADAFSEGLAAVRDPDTEKSGYIDKDGQVVIPLRYVNAGKFSEGFAAVEDETGKRFFIDKQGNPAIDLGYSRCLSEFENGMAAVSVAVEEDDGGIHYYVDYIDKSGKTLLRFRSAQSDGAPSLAEGGLIPTQDSMPYARRLMLVDNLGNRVTPLSEAYGDPEHPYRDLSMREGLMVAKLIARNNETVDRCGALNRCGTVIVPFVFGNMSAFNEGAALVFTERDGGRVGILKRPPNYDEDRGGALIRVFLNDERLDFKDADPLIENGRTLVPMRGILEALGAQVDWNEQTRTVTAVKDGITISLAVGNTVAAVNGEARNLDVPARIINNRTMVPLRFLAESLSAAVDWDETRRVIRITA